jgi:hypothetical protein
MDGPQILLITKLRKFSHDSAAWDSTEGSCTVLVIMGERRSITIAWETLSILLWQITNDDGWNEVMGNVSMSFLLT